MIKKSRRSRLKHKRQSNSQPIAVKEAKQPPQVLSLSTKQSSAAKPQATAVERRVYYSNMISDLKRTLITAAFIFILLIVLYFVFH